MEILMGRGGEKTNPIKLVLNNVEWSQSPALELFR
jgi:hypothetical protein